MPRLRRVISHSLWAALSLMMTSVVILGALYIYMELQLPNVESLRDVHLQVPLRVYSSDGKLMAEYGTKRRIPVTLDQVPQPLINAVLATEDARYYSHSGVDVIGLIRAAKAVIISGRKVQGASTITMQVARNFFLTRKKTYSRKMREILLALKIDKDFSKDKVLELYLNKVYFGNRAYGVAAAARVYYGKKLKELTLPQMAMIAGLPQSPSRNNPINNPRGALTRRNHVLARMLAVGFIDQQTYQKALRTPVTAKFHRHQPVAVHAPYIAEMVRQVMVSDYGKKAYELGLNVYTTVNSALQQAGDAALQDGLIAYSKRHGLRKITDNLGKPEVADLAQWQTTLAAMPTIHRLQPAAVMRTKQQSVQAMLADGQMITIPWSGLSWARSALQKGYVGRAPKQASDIVNMGDVIWVLNEKQTWQLVQIPQVQGALVSVDPQTGALLALSGGFDYRLSNFNRATMAERQPGSNFKPFIYSAALASGMTLASTINDAPVVMADTGENQLWRPQNDTLKFYGLTRLRVGLTESRNLVSIRLLQHVGLPFTLKYLQRFDFDPNKMPHSLSLALGSAAVTPLQISAGYAVFANGGYHITPYFIDRVVDEDGQVLFQAAPKIACGPCITHPNLPASELPMNRLAARVITPQNAYLMTQVMRGVIQNGTGRAAKVLHRTDLAGKTGTTNDQADAWFSGFNNKVETTVWVGFDDPSKTLHEYGAQAALPIWIQYMRAALKGMVESTMPQPADIVTARIDPKTGLLAAPDASKAMFEVFRKQHVPHQFAQNQPPPISVEVAPGQSQQRNNNADQTSDQLF